jgi:two-component system, sensor histidine kinase YesM
MRRDAGRAREEALRDMKTKPIRTKLLLAFLVFSAVPLVLISLVSYLATSRYYEDQVRYSAEQAFDQTYQYLQSKIATVVKDSDILIFSGEVQTALGRDQARYEGDIVAQNADMARLDAYLASFRSYEDVYRVTLWVPGWLCYVNERISYQNLDRLRADPAAKRLFSSKEKVSIFPPASIVDEYDLRKTVPVVSLYRRIRDMNNIPRFIGVIQLSMREDEIMSILDRARTSRGSLVFLRYSSGELICPEGVDAGRARALGDAFGSRPDEGSSWTDLPVSGTSYAVRTRGFPGIDWTLVEAVPWADIVYRSLRLRTWLVAAVLALSGAAALAAWLLTRQPTRRLTDLTAAMAQVGRKEGLDRLEDGPPDEIGVLTRSFRSMVRQIDQLLEAQYQAGQDLKSAELKALQAQINPHFLYNTLDLINWQAINRGAPEIAEISRALARFYALSLNSGRDVVTVEDELAHAATYVEIQNRRFEQRVRFAVEVPKALRCHPILKILLQPLVENAILHGILERGEGASGAVTITGCRRGGDLTLTVTDDGVGMSEEQMNRLLSKMPAANGHGYGVKNIIERIRLYYGDEYGLDFVSAPGAGTSVTLRLPW